MSLRKHTDSIQIELPAEDPFYLVDLDVSYNRIGENYGEDADGNRGMWVEYVEQDGYVITKVQRYVEDCKLIPCSITPEITKLVEKYMEKWVPEPEDEDDGY